MDEKIQTAIEKMAERAIACQDSLKAMQFSQAAYNFAQAMQLARVSGKK